MALNFVLKRDKPLKGRNIKCHEVHWNFQHSPSFYMKVVKYKTMTSLYERISPFHIDKKLHILFKVDHSMFKTKNNPNAKELKNNATYSKITSKMKVTL